MRSFFLLFVLSIQGVYGHSVSKPVRFNCIKTSLERITPLQGSSSTAAISDLIKSDLELLPPAEQKFTRYLYLNSDKTGEALAKDLKEQRDGMVKAVNMLSWAKDLHIPTDIDGNGKIFRINLKSLKWDESSAWNELRKLNPNAALTSLHANEDLLTRVTGEGFQLYLETF